MKITITINTDNEAFEGGWELETSRILKETAKRVLYDDPPFSICDSNGNTVGAVKVSK